MTVLVAAKNSGIRASIRAMVPPNHDVVEASSLAAARRCNADLALVAELDDGFSGALELIAWLRSQPCRGGVFACPASSDEDRVLSAYRSGVDRYFRAAEHEDLRRAIEAACAGHRDANPAACGMAGRSATMNRVREYVAKAALSPCPVLITGETGTGKELAARAIHDLGPRVGRPFVAFNCAAIPDTLLESELLGAERGAYTGAHTRREGKLIQANGGTIFLDEAGELSLTAQAKLLRVIETRRVERLGGSGSLAVDLKIVAATNRDPAEMVREGTFRRDLYFRLAVAQVSLPPLRDRIEDLPELTALFLAEIGQRNGAAFHLTPETKELLLRHSWPGNVRELRNLLEAAAVELPRGGEIAPAHLPCWFHADSEPDEKASILTALDQTRWNRGKAAARLEWSRMTLYRKMTKFGLQAPAREAARRPAASQSAPMEEMDSAEGA